MSGGKPLPFHSAIVATIQSALPSSFMDILNLISITDIPRNHDRIIQVIEHRFLESLKQPLSIEAGKAIEHVRAEQVRYMSKAKLPPWVVRQSQNGSSRPVEAEQVG